MIPRSRPVDCMELGSMVWSAVLSLGHLSSRVFMFEGGTWSCDLLLTSMAKCSSMVRPWSSELARCQAPINYTGNEVSKSTEELEYGTSFTTNWHGRNLELMRLFNHRDVSLMVTSTPQ